jgi:hypothetical protein
MYRRSFESSRQTGNRLTKPPPPEEPDEGHHFRTSEGPGRQPPCLLRTRVLRAMSILALVTMVALQGCRTVVTYEGPRLPAEAVGVLYIGSGLSLIPDLNLEMVSIDGKGVDRPLVGSARYFQLLPGQHTICVTCVCRPYSKYVSYGTDALYYGRKNLVFTVEPGRQYNVTFSCLRWFHPEKGWRVVVTDTKTQTVVFQE